MTVTTVIRYFCAELEIRYRCEHSLWTMNSGASVGGGGGPKRGKWRAPDDDVVQVVDKEAVSLE